MRLKSKKLLSKILERYNLAVPKFNFKLTLVYLSVVIGGLAFIFMGSLQSTYASGVAKSYTETLKESQYANSGPGYNGAPLCGDEWQGEFSWLYQGTTDNDGQSTTTAYPVVPNQVLTLNTQSEDVLCDGGLIGSPTYLTDNNENTCPFGNPPAAGDYFMPIETLDTPCTLADANGFFSQDTYNQWTSPTVAAGGGSVACNSGCSPIVDIPYTGNAQIWDPDTAQPSISYTVPPTVSSTPTLVTISMTVYGINTFKQEGAPLTYDCVNDGSGTDQGSSSPGSPSTYCSAYGEPIKFSFYIVAAPVSGNVSVDNGNGTFSPVPNVDIETCAGSDVTTDANGNYSFSVTTNNGFCSRVNASTIPSNMSDLTVSPNPNTPSPSTYYYPKTNSNCNGSTSYEWQWEGTSPPGTYASCSRQTNGGYNFVLKDLATLTCGQLTNIATDPAPGSYTATVNYAVSVNPFYNGNISVTSAPGGITGLPYSASTSGGIGNVATNINITVATGVYTITWVVSGGNALAPITCSQQIVVGDHPYIAAQGGDVISGSGGFGTTTCNTTTAVNSGILAFNNGPFSSGNNGGSGTNLAAISPSIINGFSSSDGSSSYYNYPITSEELTFANAATPYGGNFGVATGCQSDFFATSAQTVGPTATPTNTFNLASLASGYDGCVANLAHGHDNYYCLITPTGGGPLTISDTSATPFSGNLVLYVNGSSVINGNIVLNKNYTGGVDTIPSFWLVDEGNLNISSATSEIDGVYIAQPSSPTSNDGIIDTCTSATGIQYTTTLYSSCRTQLTIDGSMIADQIRLARTGDSIAQNTTLANKPTYASELFNYNPNAWLVSPFTADAVLPPVPVYNYYANLPPVL